MKEEMSGGVLVVVDRSGRGARRFPLARGLATLGRDPDNDIRITLPDVAAHHATVLIHDAQAVIRATGGGVTLLNGRAVSVAPLSHGDEISIGGRCLRWEYSRPRSVQRAPSPVGSPAARRERGRERRSASGGAAPRDRAVRLALEMAHRASMPGSSGGKQVAIVQPQRRDTAENTEKVQSPARGSPLTTRRSNLEPSTSTETEDKSKRKSTSRASPKTDLHTTTKASLWIESRKSSPRRRVQTPPQVLHPRRSLPNKKSTPLRMTVLKKAQSAHRTRVIKIEAPLKIDHTKQAAIMLMTGHTPKSKLTISPKNKSSSKKSPSYLVKKPSPVRKTPRGKGGRSSRGSKSAGSDIGVTPSRGSDFVRQSTRRSSKRHTDDKSASILEISDSTQNSTGRRSRSTGGKSPKKSPSLKSPKKSAMKDTSKKSSRKTESIKFDLSNLESRRDRTVEMDATRYESDESEDITLRYSESSAHSQSPSPRRPIHSRSSRMLEQLGTPMTPTSPSRTMTLNSPSRTLTSESPRARRSLRGDAMVQKALEISVSDRTRSDLSVNSIASDRTRSNLSALSPDRTRTDLSAVLSSDRTRSRLNGKSIDSDRTRSDLSADRTRSRLSATSLASDRTRSDLSAILAPDRTRSRLSANSIESDRTRSNLSATLAPDRPRSRQSANSVASDRTRSDLSATLASDRPRSRLSANSSQSSITTPSGLNKEQLTAELMRLSAFRNRTLSPRHILESYSVVDLVSFDSDDATKSVYDSAGSADSSEFGTPAVSGRRTRSTIDPVLLGCSTPYAGRNRQTRSKSHSNTTRNDKSSTSTRRSKSLTTPENAQPVVVTKPPRASRSRSRIHDDLSLLDLTEADDSSPKTSKRSRTNASETIDISNVDLGDHTEGMVTPENRKSPEMEGTPVISIRSLLDSSRGSVTDRESERETSAPARRSRLRLTLEPAGSEDEGMVTPTSVAKPSPESVKNKHSTAKKPQSKRSMIDDLNRSDTVKQLFDSPVKRKLTQSMSEFSRKRLFEDEDDDDRPVRRPTRRTLATGPSAPSLVKANDQTGDTRRSKRKSPKNDLTDVRGVKAMFGKRPKDDLRRVTGVGKLFQKKSPKNDLTDVRGVRKMFQKKSPANDLRNVSGVKRALAKSPKNDLTDVRGVRKMFKGRKQKSYEDVSGVEELFQSRDMSVDRSEVLFDALVGRPPIKAVYSRTFTARAPQRPKPRRRSLRSIDFNNVEEWLEKELQRHLPSTASTSRRVTMELKKLATDTVEGAGPILARRTRNSSFKLSPAVRSPPAKPPGSPARRRRAPPGVHSTPLKRGLPGARHAAEPGRVSPIAGPSRNHLQIGRDDGVSMSTQTMDVNEPAIPARARSPRKQKSPKKMDLSTPKNSPEKPTRGRATRTTKAQPGANTKKSRTSLVVTKKAPVMSRKANSKAADSQIVSPKGGTARTRERDAMVSLVITKPSPNLKSRRATKKSETSQTEPKLSNRRKASQKKPESPKASPKGQRNARVNKNESKASKTKVDNASVESAPPTKRSRRNATESSIKEISKTQDSVRSRRGKAVAVQPEDEMPNKRRRKVTETVIEPEIEKKPNTRGKRGQKSVQTEAVEKTPNNRGRKAQTQTTIQVESEKKTSTRGRKTQNQTTVQPETKKKQPNSRGTKAQSQVSIQSEPEAATTSARGRRKQPLIQSESEEKRSNARGKKVQFQVDIETETTSRRGRKAKQDEIEPKTAGNTSQSPAPRGRRAKAEVAVIETRRGKRKASEANEDLSNAVPQPKRGRKAAKQDETVSKDAKVQNSKRETAKSARATRAKAVEEPAIVETSRARGRKAADPKEKVVESVRGKRKANVDASPAKVGLKKKAAQASSPRARRAAGARPQPAAPTKAVRGRRR